MFYSFPIEVEPSTAEDDPTRVSAKLTLGMLNKVAVYFPWGCAGLVGIRILHYEHQLYPTNKGEWLTGNEIFIEFDTEYEITQGPGEFTVEAYNEDDFYEHAPLVGFNVLRGLGAVPYAAGWVEG